MTYDKKLHEIMNLHNINPIAQGRILAYFTKMSRDIRKELFNDLWTILGVNCEWHDKISCCCDLISSVRIANKYGIKLYIHHDIMDDMDDYDIPLDARDDLIKNQQIGNPSPDDDAEYKKHYTEK